MAVIYRFRITFEDHEEVYREIDILPKGTFYELHETFLSAIGYDVDKSSSFYVSNDQWKKGKEIAYLPLGNKKNDEELALMENAKLNRFIDDPHQKFYYIYDFNRPQDFYVELVRIRKGEEGENYPLVSKSIGKAPKPLNKVIHPSQIEAQEEEENQIENDEVDQFDEDELGFLGNTGEDESNFGEE
ncbi:MAG TPA: hypothetical protein VK076_09730 [Candidatus Sphingobacterium stercoripullorum]|uniref:Plasmid pRiA4b ORF-3 family protein n=1 Tax=Candidatus Sphingobacterium stercoripullorum TaxID=2838759 RepID=A0A9D1W923_9SPHI|nr:plasmid pRiA4b ORF-3 family protein [Candidatus Sphingobacterium stercoripullorum]HLR50844.1 hypothetical protein [Candidatus Sphingobacterium stercoripullorum]